MKIFKFLSIIFIVSAVLVSCDHYSKKEIAMYYSDSIPKIEYFYKFYGNKEYIAKEVRYFPNKTVMIEGYFNEKGEKHGKWTRYYENGKKNSEEEYVNGLKNGKSVEWYMSGEKTFEVNYVNDMPDGKWIIWDETGKKISSEEYKNGQIVR